MQDNYLKRFAERDRLIQVDPSKNTGIFIVIPVYKETTLLFTLDSLLNCKPPEKEVEVLLVFNCAVGDQDALKINQTAFEEVKAWRAQHTPFFDLHLIKEHQLDPKFAGVGLARKIGMDEAIRRAATVDVQDPILLCLDADCTVSENYLQAIERAFEQDHFEAASIYFEHPLSGVEFPDSIYESILYYELHLRYFKQAMNYIGLPYDQYTVGSAMAVRSSAYVKEGGMNKKKAGEDFYFLQKYLIKQSLGEISNATVFPSPRTSDRVPFGTGRAMLDHLEARKDLKKSYSAKSFKLLKKIMGTIKESYPIHPDLGAEWDAFIDREKWKEQWHQMIRQSSDWESFYSRFLQWFTPFRLLKFIHHLRDTSFEDDLLVEQVKELLGLDTLDPKTQLMSLRAKDRLTDKVVRKQ